MRRTFDQSRQPHAGLRMTRLVLPLLLITPGIGSCASPRLSPGAGQVSCATIACLSDAGHDADIPSPDSEVASVGDGGGVTPSGTLALDCGSRLDQVPEFEAHHCQMIGADVPTMVCPQTKSAPGALRLRVLQPNAVVLGQPVPLGASGVASIELSASTPKSLVGTSSPGGLGFVVFDQFSIGGALHGHFVGAQIQVLPPSVSMCRVSDEEFSADFGPGITVDGGVRTACTPGADQTCNDDPSLNSIHGVCQANGTCVCAVGGSLNPNTGKCL